MSMLMLLGVLLRVVLGPELRFFSTVVSSWCLALVIMSVWFID